MLRDPTQTQPADTKEEEPTPTPDQQIRDTGHRDNETRGLRQEDRDMETKRQRHSELCRQTQRNRDTEGHVDRDEESKRERHREVQIETKRQSPSTLKETVFKPVWSLQCLHRS